MIPTLDEKHVYRNPETGRVIPGTTSVLGEYIKVERWDDTYFVHGPSGQAIPAEIMERASRFGNAFHKGGKLLFTGQGLNWNSLSPVLVPALSRLSAWAEENLLETLVCEQPLYSRVYDYAGTMDVLCKLKGIRPLCLVDLKSGMFDLAGPQTAAYANLYRENFKFKGFVNRYVLYISRDGEKLEFVPMTGKTDFQYFLWKLNAYRWEQARKAA